MKERLILASGSPRRRELLENLRIPFSVVVSEIEEIIDPKLSPAETVMSLALQKAEAVAENYQDAYVMGADTVVVLDDQILGKPKDEADAVNMLKKLSGKTHDVFTGVALVHGTENHLFYERTKVTFWDLSEQEIYEYAATKEPLDKAGAYGIQGFGSLLVKEIHGDYFSVVGLPVARTVRELRAFGLLDKREEV
ncbi:Maf family protein [Metabacillus fastidiosus]|uniref:Maf family protein n=1 Tax=Metabacillus fastidiosus TaxID=1458 RepID=UPI002DBDF79A|nr:Maf family protein [Metabacillus fastidiosus]MEC2076784.1 Maf family protein [Metabacillus fastidiosus]